MEFDEWVNHVKEILRLDSLEVKDTDDEYVKELEGEIKTNCCCIMEEGDALLEELGFHIRFKVEGL